MTRDEARRLLGVEAGVDRRQLRRAYLRGVKAHSPERDPEGFAQVRAAFERLELYVVVTPGSGFEPAMLDLAPLRTGEAPTGGSAHEESTPEPVAPVEEDRAPAEEDSAPAEEDSAPVEEDRAPAEEDSAPAEEDSAPGEEDDEFADFIQGRAYAILPTIFDRVLARDVLRAASLVEAAMDQGDAEGQGVWPGFVNDVLLELFAESEASRARALVARFTEHQRRVHPACMGTEGARWQLASELAHLPSSFPAVFQCELARAVRMLDTPESAQRSGALLRALSLGYPYYVADVRGALAIHAPSLFHAFGGDIPLPAPSPTVVRRGSGRLYLVAVVALAGALRICTLDSGPSESRNFHAYYPPTSPGLGQLPDASAGGSLGDRARPREVMLIARQACGRSPAACTRFALLMAALRDDDCEAAGQALARMRADPRYASSLSSPDDDLVFQQAVEDVCAGSGVDILLPADAGIDGSSAGAGVDASSATLSGLDAR